MTGLGIVPLGVGDGLQTADGLGMSQNSDFAGPVQRGGFLGQLSVESGLLGQGFIHNGLGGGGQGRGLVGRGSFLAQDFLGLSFLGFGSGGQGFLGRRFFRNCFLGNLGGGSGLNLLRLQLGDLGSQLFLYRIVGGFQDHDGLAGHPGFLRQDGLLEGFLLGLGDVDRG